MTKLQELIAKVPHEADLSSVQGLPGSVVFVNSKDYPCKPDCTRCGFEAALAECEPGPSDNDLYASYANHCAIEKKLPLTFHSWKREQKK